MIGSSRNDKPVAKRSLCDDPPARLYVRAAFGAKKVTWPGSRFHRTNLLVQVLPASGKLEDPGGRGNVADLALLLVKDRFDWPE